MPGWCSKDVHRLGAKGAGAYAELEPSEWGNAEFVSSNEAILTEFPPPHVLRIGDLAMLKYGNMFILRKAGFIPPLSFIAWINSRNAAESKDAAPANLFRGRTLLTARGVQHRRRRR